METQRSEYPAFAILGTEDTVQMRDWDTGAELAEYQGVFVAYGLGTPWLMRVWQEDGERAFEAIRPLYGPFSA